MSRLNHQQPCTGRAPAGPLPDGSRIRVMEVLATGTNGGAQESLVNTVLRLDHSRHDVSVVSLSHGSTVKRLERLKIPVEVIEDDHDDRAAEALAERMIALKTQVIHAHMFRADVIAVYAADLVKKRTGVRPLVVSTLHSSRFRSAGDRELLEKLTPRIDWLIAVSDAIVRKIVAENRDSTNISRIYNGVDLERFDEAPGRDVVRKEFGISADAPVAVAIGRLEPEKGHPTLIEAWPLVHHHFPQARLLIAGEGSERDRLEGLAAAHLRSELCCDSVAFLGRRDDIPAVLAAADVVAMPSYREAQGIAILEALAAERPVVASNVGGIPEMVTDGVTGTLVPSHDPSALAAAIIALFTHPDRAAKLAAAGHEMVHEEFCIDYMMRDIEAIYATAVGRSAASIPDRYGKIAERS
jgi:glycosyltransferase involved in cell wall biosynthesis